MILCFGNKSLYFTANGNLPNARATPLKLFLSASAHLLAHEEYLFGWGRSRRGEQEVLQGEGMKRGREDESRMERNCHRNDAKGHGGWPFPGKLVYNIKNAYLSVKAKKERFRLDVRERESSKRNCGRSRKLAVSFKEIAVFVEIERLLAAHSLARRCRVGCVWTTSGVPCV
ncbi:hypothetical protein EVAR_53470_1 [Eumeta japonica]|uniref:Uncharacterized protein n=1 Tax=Eumeta variegata TaxID=151549 RepID=A0A4C1XR73_EUMVA|nr:hypothetical protein EVAR_53470_1 [Eumeta japonica]